jgi:hypothetical protein
MQPDSTLLKKATPSRVALEPQNPYLGMLKPEFSSCWAWARYASEP